MSVLRRLREKAILSRLRGLVDETFYLSAYPDVAQAKTSAFAHFNAHGWREGRNPSQSFHTLYYAHQHMPGGVLSSNPLAHYAKVRRADPGIATTPHDDEEWAHLQKESVALYFDNDYYEFNYGNQLEGKSTIDHYFAFGWLNGCNPCTTFDTRHYLRTHIHLFNSNVNPFYHYIRSKAEASRTEQGRGNLRPVILGSAQQSTSIQQQVDAISREFDVDYYLGERPDIAKSGLDPLIHFFECGWREGANSNNSFWTDYYLAKYPEVARSKLNPFYHFLAFGKDAGYQPNPLGTECWPQGNAPEEQQWERISAAAQRNGDVVVVIPVYKGYDNTLATIYSVLENEQNVGFRLVVINDASPEPALTEKLRKLSERGFFEYVENHTNYGFVKTANKAFELARPHDVVLLNSDTIVYGDWLDRLHWHAVNEPTIATVTPFSNNATLCSYPEVNKDNYLALECGSPATLDQYARDCNWRRGVRIPTGVGFCFYIRRNVLERLSGFDLAFGRGYGEENDFCLRADKLGYRNILATDVFVYHKGKVSFGQGHREAFVAGQATLLKKHPDYTRRLEAFSNSEIPQACRERLDLYRLIRQLGPRSAVMITLNATGGIVTHVNELATQLERESVSVLMLHVAGNSVKISLFNESRQIFSPALRPVNLNSNLGLLNDLLNWANPEIIHVHSFAGLNWRPTRSLMDALASQKNGYFVTLHDYDSVCHRHHMVDREGRYCSPMRLSDCRACVQGDPEGRDFVDPLERQTAYQGFLERATRVFVPSQDAQTRLSQFFPSVTFFVRQHFESFKAAHLLPEPKPTAPMHVVAIGAIGPHKGCDVLYSLALDAKLRSLPLRYSIVGYSAISPRMQEVGVFETGRYRSEEECLQQLERLKPHFAIFPSIWPETHCYALSIAFALGLPPIVFDLGAQADRVQEAGFGVVFPERAYLEPAQLNDAILGLSVSDEWRKRRVVHFPAYSQLTRSYYEILEDIQC